MKQTVLFDADAIKRALDDDVARRVAALVLLEETASTNDYLLHGSVADADGDDDARFYACIAETQTAGKGRRGRKVWSSPRNGNLYLSVMRVSPGVASRSAWLALTVAGEVVSALAAVCARDDADFGVKWPNDVYFSGGKLGGVLVEAKGERCVVGLGLNLHPPASDEVGFAWAALDEVCGEALDRTRLAAAMITAVIRAFDRVDRDSIEALMRSWRRHDLLSGNEVTVSIGEEVLTGIARGVDKYGGLEVEHEDSDGLRVYYSDEVSVRW